MRKESNGLKYFPEVLKHADGKTKQSICHVKTEARHVKLKSTSGLHTLVFLTKKYTERAILNVEMKCK